MLKLRLRLELIFKSIFELPTKSIGKENGQDARFRRHAEGHALVTPLVVEAPRGKVSTNLISTELNTTLTL